MIVAFTIAVLGFAVDLINTLNTPGIDFRNRIVGARLMRMGLDPYYFKWTPGYSEALLDPLDKPSSPITRTTVPPSTLALFAPIANLPYRTLRLLWFAFQWTALLLILFILARNSRLHEKAMWIWIVGLVFVSGSHAWHVHIYVGQTYILFILTLTLAYQLLINSHRLGSVAAGFLIGVTASMSFPVVLMGLPMLIYRRWKILMWTVVGFVFGIGGSMLIAGVKTWKSYYTAMRIHGMIEWLWLQWPVGNYPQIIEGMNWSGKPLSPVLVSCDASIVKVFNQAFGINIARSLMPVLAIVVLIMASVMYAYRKKKPSTSLVFQVGLVFVFISSFFLPGVRIVYQDVIWLMLLSLVIINSKSLKELLNPLLIFAMIGLLLSVGFTWLPGRGKIMEAAMVIYFALTTLSFLRRSGEPLESDF
jgi:hypothetical protein